MLCPLPNHTFKHIVMTALVLFVPDSLFSVIIPLRDLQRNILLKVDVSVPCLNNSSPCWFGDVRVFKFKFGFAINIPINRKLKSWMLVNNKKT